MPLFESKEKKRARRQVAIRMGKQKVNRYIKDCRQMAEKYQGMAKKALSLGDESGCEQYLCRKVQYSRQANKWDAFLLRMEDFVMQGKMSGAMEGLLNGMQALVKQVKADASAKKVTDVMSDLNITMAQLGQKEEEFSAIMDSIQLDMGSSMPQGEHAQVPEDMKGEVARMKDELMDEVVVEEKVGSGQEGGSSGIDERIDKGLDEVQDLKNKKK
jgi:phage shock protein A